MKRAETFVYFCVFLGVVGFIIFPLIVKRLAYLPSDMNFQMGKKTLSSDIIVNLRLAYKPEGQLNPEQQEMQQKEITRVRQALLEELSPYKVEVLNGSDTWLIPSVALRVDEKALPAVQSSQYVLRIEPNQTQ